MKRITRFIELVKHGQQIFVTERPTQISAALAYYGLISLAPLLFIMFSLAALFPQKQAVFENVDDQVGGLLSQEQFYMFEEAVNNSPPALDLGDPILTTVVGVLILIYSASALFNELQFALNRVWGLGNRPRRPTLSFIRKRTFAFIMVFGISFILILSSQTDLALTYAEANTSLDLPVLLLDVLVVFLLVTLSLALIFKILPETKVAWRDVWLGSLLTALLVMVGGYLLLYYLRIIEFSSALAVASFIALLLIGINYIALIIILGAVFCKAYAQTYGSLSANDQAADLQPAPEDLA
jgi:membrane protein